VPFYFINLLPTSLLYISILLVRVDCGQVQGAATVHTLLTCHHCHRPLDTPLWNIVCDKLSFFLNSLPPTPPGSGRVSHQSPGNVSRLRPPARPAGLDIETVGFVADCGNRMVRKISPVGVDGPSDCRKPHISISLFQKNPCALRYFTQNSNIYYHRSL
jgi:hypothetical protein